MIKAGLKGACCFLISAPLLLLPSTRFLHWIAIKYHFIMNSLNSILLEKDWGIFLGSFSNNSIHKHYAIQINIPLSSPVKTITSNQMIKSNQAVFIPTNIEHQVNCPQVFLLILINPILVFSNKDTIAILENEAIHLIQKMALSFLNKQIDRVLFEAEIRKVMSKLLETAPIDRDDRIQFAIEFLRTHHDRIVSLSEIAKHCFLSESRFLHLFKSEMGITYRRAQLWYRISQSFKSLSIQNISQTAYQFGFTDGAHYSKVFKESFGFSPKQFLKNSQFIQVSGPKQP